MHNRDKLICNLALSFVTDIKISDHTEYDGTDKVDKQIFHSVDQTDIQVSTLNGNHLPVCRLNLCRHNIPYHNGRIGVGCVQRHGRNLPDDEILLHIGCQQCVAGKFKEFPENTDCHGKTERHNGKENRGKLKPEPLIAVENIHQAKAECGKHKAVDRMQHGVPERKPHVIAFDFPQNFRAEHKSKYQYFQCGRQCQMEGPLHQRREQKQNQCKYADKHTLPAVLYRTPDNDPDHNDTHHTVDDKCHFFLPDLIHQTNIRILFERLLDKFFLFFAGYPRLFFFLHLFSFFSFSNSDHNPVAMVYFVLNDLCRKPDKTLSTLLHLQILPGDLDDTVTRHTTHAVQ